MKICLLENMKGKIMGNIIVGGLIAIAVVAVIVDLVKKKKSGKSIGCGGNCESCMNNINCQPKNNR